MFEERGPSGVHLCHIRRPRELCSAHDDKKTGINF